MIFLTALRWAQPGRRAFYKRVARHPPVEGRREIVLPLDKYLATTADQLIDTPPYLFPCKIEIVFDCWLRLMTLAHCMLLLGRA
jgi:hypothetical protein